MSEGPAPRPAGDGDADRVLVEGALAALGIGAWSFDLRRDRFTCDARTALLFGLSPDERRAGVPVAQVAEAVHPDDRERYHARRRLTLRFGGPFSLEYRTVPRGGVERRVMARGLYRHDAAGALVEARGVVIDLTGGSDDLGRHVFTAASLDGAEDVPAIDLIAMHAIEVHRAVKDGATLEARLLRPAADELLAEVLRVVALSASARGH